MRGEVLYFDAERGIGFIGGDDGNRYHFGREDLIGSASIHKGMRIEFLVEGNRANKVMSLGGSAALPAMEPAGATGQPPVAPTVRAGGGETARRSLWSYFREAITGKYANFRGRARRKEYWGFLLFFVLAVMFLAAAGSMIDVAVGNMDDEEPLFAMGFAVLLTIALIIPSLAVTVRRIHDIGLSGWFILLGFVPSIGNLIIFVFCLIPSQKHENKWGPVPQGAI